MLKHQSGSSGGKVLRGTVDSKPGDARTISSVLLLLRDGESCASLVAPLLRRAAGVNCQDGDGRTALSHACERGHLEAVKLLVRNNADPEIVDAWGNTALMYAAVGGHSHVVEFLVRAFKRLGLQIDRRNKAGNSAVKVATFLGHAGCVSALTSPSWRKGGDPSAQPRGTLAELEREVDGLAESVELLQTSDRAHFRSGKNCLWLKRRQSLFLSEETGTGGQLFSGVLTPRPPSRSERLKSGPNISVSGDQLPVLDEKAPESASLSPADCAPSVLGILLTPDLGRKTPRTSEHRARRFRDSYYQKRCSLPVAVLSSAPPERTTLRRRKAGAPHVAAPTSVSPAKSFSALSHRLLRRFTSPEFRGAAAGAGEPLGSASERMPRSATFPLQDARHPQVDSKRSVDSISSVKCEFDFQCRMTKS